MSIISPSNFSSTELKLPIDNINDIQDYINKHEPKILKRVLGYNLYKDFISGLAEVTPLQKWIDLRDGEEYTDSNNNLQYYDGIENLIANYVYGKIIENIQQYATDSGIVDANLDNALKADPNWKIVSTWNVMIDEKIYLDEFIISQNKLVENTYENFTPVLICKKNIFNI